LPLSQPEGRSVFISGAARARRRPISNNSAAQGSKWIRGHRRAGPKALAEKTGAHFLKCDIRDLKAYQAASATSPQHGPITALITMPRATTAMSSRCHARFWDERIAVNCASFCHPGVAPGMRKGGRGAV